MAHRIGMPALAAMAMSVGWGYRGDYGHESGAMMPGALVGLAVALTSGRPDWWGRAPLLGMLGAIGWAFGGQNSYGRVIGYTCAGPWADIAYGFACLFVIGGLWGGIGGGILALGVSRSRSELERYVGPLVALYLAWWGLFFSGATAALVDRFPMHDTDWLPATAALIVAGIYASAVPKSRPACGLIATLASGWWVGFGVLTLGLGLRMTPPRSDNWSGCLGLFAALISWLARRRDRVALRMAAVVAMAGGIGFAVGGFVNVLGRAGWGPIGASETLASLDYWKWMEQLFGLLMGAGVGIGFSKAARAPLAEPVEDMPGGPLRLIAPTFLMILVPWENLWKNVRSWDRDGVVEQGLFGVAPGWWIAVVGLAASAAVASAILRAGRGRLPMAPSTPFGRAQVLLLYMLWVPALGALLQALPSLSGRGTLFVHVTFWLTASACTLIVVNLPARPRPTMVDALPLAADDRRWRPRPVALAVPVVGLVLSGLLAALATASHDGPLPGSHRRFGPESGGP